MSIEAGVLESPPLAAPSAKTKRQDRLKEGSLVLTSALDTVTKFKLKIEILLKRFEEITHSNITEHLLEEEKTYFREKIDVSSLPVKGMIEVWKKSPGTTEYHVTEYKKLK